MKFTITNTIPKGTHYAPGALDKAIGTEFGVAFDGTIIGGAVLVRCEVDHDTDEIEMEFESDGFNGLMITNFPTPTGEPNGST